MHLPEARFFDVEDHGLFADFVHDFADAFAGIGHQEHEALGYCEAHAEDEHGDGNDGTEEAVEPEVERYC